MAQSRKARIDRLVRGLEEGGATVDPGASDARILADGLLRTVALPAAAANRPDQTRFAAHRGRWR